MKLGLFTDPHYSSRTLSCGVRYNSRSLDKIRKAYTHFAANGCELVICLGDLIDTEDSIDKIRQNLKCIAEVIRASGIPTYCLRGNHDAFLLEYGEFYSILGGCEPRDVELDGKHLIFADACYFKDGRRYSPGDTDWTDTFYPFAKELAAKLECVTGDAYVFMHQNIDPSAPPDHRLANADEMFDVINRSGAARAVFQGHYHKGCTSQYGGVKYITLPAVCEHENAYFIYDI